MRDGTGTGTLGTGLATEPRGDSAKRPCSLRARESPRPPGARPWAEAPAGDDHGDAQNETVSRETKSAPREAWLPGGTQVPACLTESSRRNSAAAVAPGKTVDPSLGPAGERLAGVPCGVGAAPVRDWLEGPRATSSHRGRCRRGELGGPGLPRGSRSGAGVSAGEPPGRPEVLPSDGSALPRHTERGEVPPRAPRPSADLPPAPGPVGL
ncbi:unnamed protein product [Pipistrellus nathusii]|uniref:SIPAR domain-containing protein n=1 Tax=Pipistrellus nathusii TaxID=59473 RepID=A0ABP0A8Y6_PIPNA